MPPSIASSDSGRRSDRASDHDKDEEMEEEQPAVAASAPRGSDGNSSAGDRDEDNIINNPKRGGRAYETRVTNLRALQERLRAEGRELRRTWFSYNCG